MVMFAKWRFMNFAVYTFRAICETDRYQLTEKIFIFLVH
jgi:hypothetical protein